MRKILDLLNNKQKPKAVIDIPKEVDRDALDFEMMSVYLVHQSEKKAWTVAMVCVVVVLLLIIATIIMLPLKTAVPYIIRYDSTTGYTDIMTTVTQVDVEINEAVSKYFVQRYVTLREGYYYETLQQDYDLVQQFGSNEVNDEYRSIYSGEKNSRDIQLGSRVMEKAEVVSVVLGKAATFDTATVRIRLLTFDKKNMKNTPKETNKVVTLTFEFSLQTRMSEAYRLNNPLGFRVISYRVDSEITR